MIPRARPQRRLPPRWYRPAVAPVLLLLLPLLCPWAPTKAHAPQPLSATPPTDNPVLALYPAGGAFPTRPRFDAAWFPWDNVVAAAPIAAAVDPAAAYQAAAAAVLKRNPLGGVVYFPPGEFALTGDLNLVDRVVLRGAPTGTAPASKGPQGGPGPLMPTTVFTFPDRSLARLSCANCTAAGVVNILSDGGAVSFSQRPEAPDSTASAAGSPPLFLVLSNLIRHVAYKYPVAPPATFYQEWPYRFATAVGVEAHSNVLVANNLLGQQTRTTPVRVSFLPSARAGGGSRRLTMGRGGWTVGRCNPPSVVVLLASAVAASPSSSQQASPMICRLALPV